MVHSPAQSYIARLVYGFTVRTGRVASSIDLGIIVGLALYCLYEFVSTGSFGFQRSSYRTAGETEAAIILGIGAGVAATLWFLVWPIERLFGSPTLSPPEDAEPFPAEPAGIDGGPPSHRSLFLLMLGETRTYFLAAVGVLLLIGVLYVPLGRYVSNADVYLSAAGLLIFLAFMWRRVARLLRLCRVGVEVEGRLQAVTRASSDGEKTARYVYQYRGRPGSISNSSWLMERLALRHGEHIVVLIDPRHPDDGVILGRHPSKVARTP